MTLDSPWFWLIVGLLLLASEILSGAFVLVFFGLAGLSTAALAGAGVNDPALLLTFFSATSLATLFLFRKKILAGRKGPEPKHADVGNSIVLSDRLPAGAEGTILYQGAPWTAVNLEEQDLEKGSHAKIVKTEGVKLFVKSEK